MRVRRARRSGTAAHLSPRAEGDAITLHQPARASHLPTHDPSRQTELTRSAHVLWAEVVDRPCSGLQTFCLGDDEMIGHAGFETVLGVTKVQFVPVS